MTIDGAVEAAAIGQAITQASYPARVAAGCLFRPKQKIACEKPVYRVHMIVTTHSPMSFASARTSCQPRSMRLALLVIVRLLLGLGVMLGPFNVASAAIAASPCMEMMAAEADDGDRPAEHNSSKACPCAALCAAGCVVAPTHAVEAVTFRLTSAEFFSSAERVSRGVEPHSLLRPPRA